MTELFVIVVGATIAWALWRASKGRPLFVVKIEAGRARTQKGTVTTAFLRRVEEVAAANEIRHAEIHGYPRGRLIRLWFSREVGEASRQQLRNWWAGSGWGAPYEKPRPRCA
jgi:hypothetical protein